MAVGIWAGVAFPFLIIVGAVARISPELYEAAELDGATGWRQTRHVTLPLIQPVLVMLPMLELIWNFNSFTLIWAMTRGGPVSSTSTLPVRLYTAAFRDFDYGEASAIGVMASAGADRRRADRHAVGQLAERGLMGLRRRTCTGRVRSC